MLVQNTLADAHALVQGRKVLTPVWWKAALHSPLSVHLLSTSGPPPPIHSKKDLVNIVTGVEHDVKSDEMLLERSTCTSALSTN